MKKIVIIAAMEEEMEAIRNIMDNVCKKNIFEMQIYEGEINNKECVLTKCGVGKVNSARSTQILIDNYDVDFVINVGSAGALDDNLNIGDMVIADKLVQHDFDITAFGHKKGYISDVGDTFNTDNTLFNKAKEVIETIGQEETFKAQIGTIATGDIFCTSINMKNKIRQKFDAACVEMEGAAIAQVCYLDKVPFIVIRSISDSPNEKNHMDFNEYLKIASKRCAQFIKKMI